MLIFSFYFIQNAGRLTAAEKEFDITIHMTMEHVLVPRSKKKRNRQKK